MERILIDSITATVLISAISLIGAITFFINKKTVSKLALYLVAFSTGALLGGAFFHLLPEAVEISSGITPYIYLIAGVSIFFIFEHYLKWHHCRENNICKEKTFTYMSLMGDGIHNFIDGLIIVSAFFININVGIATAIAIAAHELPQELGDFGVLIHGGFSRKKALFWNFISSLAAVIGTFIGYILINSFSNMTSFLLPFAAGGFIYIAMSDLIPELHKESKTSISVFNFILFLIGVIFMLFIKLYFVE